MDIKLIKDHIFITKVVPVGTIVGVDIGLGKELIDKGIAIDITYKYRKEVAKAKAVKEKELKEIEEKEDEERLGILTDKVVEKINKKKKNNK